MGQFSKQSEELVQLARLALGGRQKDVLTYLRKLARQYQGTTPDFSARLQRLIQDQPVPIDPTRSIEMPTVPVDTDTRLRLLRVEDPVELEVEPIWPAILAAEFSRIIAERTKHSELARLGVSPTRSLLLVGPPGVGKTLAARWIADRLEWPLLNLDLSSVMSSFLGRTGNNIRQVLDFAKDRQCVMLLDEIDAIAKRRDDATEIGELKRLVNVLLQEVDLWPDTGLLVAATNHPDLLDPAVWRRFDLIIRFPAPSFDDRKRFIRSRLQDCEHGLTDWHDVLALATEGLSFSDLERELRRMKRDSVVEETSLSLPLERLVESHVKGLSVQQRKQVAQELAKLGHSQRSVHEMTGVSRDTLRKMGRRNLRTNVEDTHA